MTSDRRHAPTRFRTFIRVHQAVLAQHAATRFVGSDSLVLTAFPTMYVIEGEIACMGGILISVSKVLRVLDDSVSDPMVQTHRYRYHASLQNVGNLLLYESAHSDHNRDHHRHEYDPWTDTELPDSPQMVGDAGWPHLGDVISEVEQWYWDNFAKLPEGYAEPGRCR